MSDQDDLHRIWKAAMADRRRHLSAPPTPEEIIAYRDELLDVETGAEVEAKLAAFPEAGRSLIDLSLFPENRPAPDRSELTDERVEASWQRFRERVKKRKSSAAEKDPEKTSNSVERLAATRITLERRPSALRRNRDRLLLAAGLLFALGAGWTAGLVSFETFRAKSGPKTTPQVVASVTQLFPPDHRRERGGETTIREPTAGLAVLMLTLPGEAQGHSMAAILRNGSGESVWSAESLEPTPEGIVHLGIPPGFLAPDRYRLAILDRDGDEVVVYELRWLKEP